MNVVGLVLGQGMALVGVGGALGLVGGGIASVALRSLLAGVSPGDPWTLATASCVLLAVGAVASVGPAVKALNVDPQEPLQAE